MTRLTHALLALIALIVVSTSAAQAQTLPSAPSVTYALDASPLQGPPPVATGTMRLGWDQAAATLADAQGYRYLAYANGATTGIVVTATCTGTASPFACSTPLPAPVTVIGDHSVVLAAQLSLGPNLWSDDARSLPFAFRVVAVPSAPDQLRLERGALQ